MYKLSVNGKHRESYDKFSAAMEAVDHIVESTQGLQDICSVNHNDQDEELWLCVWKYKESDDLLIIVVDKE